MKFSDKQIQIIVSIFKWLFLIGAILVVFSEVSFLIFLKNHAINDLVIKNFGTIGFIYPILGACYALVVFYGLGHKKAWIIPAILIVETFELLIFLYQTYGTYQLSIINELSPSTFFYTSRIIQLASFLFIIYFFSKSEVHDYFKFCFKKLIIYK